MFTALGAASPTVNLYTVTGDNAATGAGDFARDVSVDAAGNIYLAGMLNNTATLEETAVVKLNASGVEQWRKLFGGTTTANYDEGNAMTLTADGPVVTGMIFNGQYFEIGTAQLRASDGAIMWFESNNSYARDLGLAVQTVPSGGSAPAGRVVIAGWGGENRSPNSATGLAKPQTLIVQVVDRASCTLKVDGRPGAPLATTDGLIILRRILGIFEPETSIGTTPTNDIDTRENLVSTLVLRKDYDIDADGNVDFKDALLIVRYLLGIRGDAVTTGLGLTGGRNQWLPAVSPSVNSSVKLYLEACGV